MHLPYKQHQYIFLHKFINLILFIKQPTNISITSTVYPTTQLKNRYQPLSINTQISHPPRIHPQPYNTTQSDFIITCYTIKYIVTYVETF